MTIAAALCPVYRQAAILPALFDSICRQTLPLTIVWSDDCSPDDSYAVLERLIAGYAGPHRMLLRRNAENLGHAQNLFAAMQAVDAEIYIEFDDDFSAPERAEALVAALTAQPHLQLLGSAYRLVSEDGCTTFGSQSFPTALLQAGDLATGRRALVVAGHTFAWRRVLRDAFPAPRGRIGSGDFVLAFRAVLQGGMAFLPQALVDYRQAPESVSRTRLDHGEGLADARRCYAVRAASWVGLGRQLELDLHHAVRTLGFDPRLAAALGKRVVAHHLHGAELAQRAATGSRWRWAQAAARALPVHGLGGYAARHLLLASIPGLFYGARRLLRWWRRH